MFSHATVGTNDFDRAVAFYDAVLGAVGIERFFMQDGYAGYGAPADNQFWVLKPYDGKPAAPGNGTMTAFLAPDRHAVTEFHAAALAHGGTDEGGPGLRPEYHENYFGCYVRDPDGNKLCCVCHRKEA